MAYSKRLGKGFITAPVSFEGQRRKKPFHIWDPRMFKYPGPNIHSADPGANFLLGEKAPEIIQGF